MSRVSSRPQQPLRVPGEVGAARRILNTLGSHSSRAERQAERAIDHLDAEVFGEVVDALRRHPNAHARAVAASALVRFGARARPALRRALGDPAMTVRLHALLALDRRWAPSVGPAVIRLLADRSGGVRVNAIAVLSRHQVRRAATTIRRSLNDPTWYVRQESARALGALGGRGARASLRRALADPRKAVREAAREALERLG